MRFSGFNNRRVSGEAQVETPYRASLQHHHGRRDDQGLFLGVWVAHSMSGRKRLRLEKVLFFLISGDAIPNQLHDCSCMALGDQREIAVSKEELAREVRPDPVGNHGRVDMMGHRIAFDLIGSAIGGT